MSKVTFIRRAPDPVRQKMLELLVSDPQTDLNASSRYGQTALWGAARIQNMAAVETLVKAGARVDIADSEQGCTPLHLAAKLGDVQLVKALLTGCGAAEALAMTDANGQNPLSCAQADGYKSIVRLLKLKSSQVDQLHDHNPHVCTP